MSPVLSSQVNRALLIAALSTLLTAPLAFLQPSAEGQSPTECVTAPSNANEGNIVTSPFWATDVTMRSVGTQNDAESVFPEVNTGTNTAFVTEDDSIRLTFTVFNRIPDGEPGGANPGSQACETLQNVEQPLGVLRIKWRYPESDRLQESDNWNPFTVNCLSQLENYNGACAVDHRITVAPGAGEHRILYVIGSDSGGTFTALLGIERVFIVDQKPDLTPSLIEWTDPAPEDRVTVYGVEALSTFRITVDNDGNYPYWNPNGGRLYCGWPSWDGPDANNEPDFFDDGAACGYTNNDDLLPYCDTVNEDFWADDQNADDLVCSYKRGSPLQMPIGYTATRTGDSVVVESGVHAQADLWLGLDDNIYDKSDAIVPGVADIANCAGVVNPPPGKCFILTMFDRNRKAGEFDFNFVVAQGIAPAVLPDESATNNDIEETFDVFGVDLKWASKSIIVEAAPGCGLSVETACPAGEPILVKSAKFINDGDEEADDEAEVLNREFKAAIFLNGVVVANSIETFPVPPGIPQTDDDAETVWDGFSIPTHEEGGSHAVELRLDHIDNYEGDQPPIDDPTGRVAERTELNRCPGPTEIEDNVYCITLIFEDDSAPTIADLDVDVERDEGVVPELLEGATHVFSATVDDNSIATVVANFTYPDGTQEDVPMALAAGEVDQYEVSKSFVGQLGSYLFKVKATDTTGNAAVSETGLEFTIAELAKTVVFERMLINGQTDFLLPENIPPYEGTASAPENFFRIETLVTDDGHPQNDDPPFLATGKQLRLYDAAGKFRLNVSMGALTTCEITSPLLPAPKTGTGTQCTDPAIGETVTEGSIHPVFIVDNSCDAAPDTPGDDGSCGDVPIELQDTWKEVVKLAWVGSFDVGVEVTDVNERAKITNNTAAIADSGDPLEIADAQLDPSAVDPGETIAASADVSDGLRVERVFLKVTKPDATVVEFDLPNHPVINDEDDTQSGVWSGTFGSGVGEDFDQATTAQRPYKVDLVAMDFALTEESVALPDVTVDDIDTPVLAQFFTVPPEVQEEGGFVTWEAKITDATAIKTPQLTVTRPNVGTQTFPMVFNEDTGRWNFTLDAEPTTLGTWTYSLSVEDWAGHAVTGTGSMRVVTNLAPQALNWKPGIEGADGKVYGGAAPTIEVDILDFGGGVDPTSLEMTVNNQAVVFERRTVANGFHLVHTVRESQAFDDGETVTVKVKAADLSVPPLVTEALTHQFIVDARPATGSFEATPSVFRSGQRIVGANSDITVGATDAASGPGEVQVVVQHLGGEAVPPRETLTFKKEGDFRLEDLDDVFRGHGNYQVVVTPFDAVGNKGGELRQNLLFDAAPPKVRVIPQPGKPAEAIYANVTDESRVLEAFVKYRANAGDEQSIELELDDGGWQGTIIDQGTGQPFPKGTTITYVVEARDFFGNTGSNLESSFNAGDVVPTITITAPQDGDTIEGTTAITWTASDLETAASALKISLYYSKTGDEFIPIADAQTLGNVGRYNLDTTQLPNGEVVLQAIVWDGTLFGVDTVNVVVRNLNRIFSNPKVEPTSPNPGEDVIFSVVIEGDVRKAWANITKDGEVVIPVPLTNAGGGLWKGTFRAPSESGVYQMNLEALTADGSIKNPAAYTFGVQGSGQDGKGYVAEWTILSILFAAALAVGVVGIVQRWK